MPNPPTTSELLLSYEPSELVLPHGNSETVQPCGPSELVLPYGIPDELPNYEETETGRPSEMLGNDVPAFMCNILQTLSPTSVYYNLSLFLKANEVSNAYMLIFPYHQIQRRFDQSLNLPHRALNCISFDLDLNAETLISPVARRMRANLMLEWIGEIARESLRIEKESERLIKEVAELQKRHERSKAKMELLGTQWEAERVLAEEEEGGMGRDWWHRGLGGDRTLRREKGRENLRGYW
ncbi:MAG: hypothetical protein Q9200_006012 [Gallowayella weberi]